MNKLSFLGRGSGYHKSENNTSAYIKKGDTLLLIDCGETVFKKILKLNLLEGIKEVHLFITHMHSDHVGSLGGFVGYAFWAKEIKTKIYFDEIENIKTYLELVGIKEGQFFECHLPKNIVIDELKVMVSSCETKHSKALNSYAYGLKFEKGNDIFYSGDCAETPIDLVPFLEKGNIVYHDTCLKDGNGNVHTSLKKLCEEVPMEYRKQVYCMHIEGENFEEAAKAEGFNVVVEES